jgi:hypothetical protein
MGHQLTVVQQGAERGDAELARQIDTISRQLDKVDKRDTAAEDRDVVMERQISAVVQQHTGQLDKIETVLTDCTNKRAN